MLVGLFRIGSVVEALYILLARWLVTLLRHVITVYVHTFARVAYYFYFLVGVKSEVEFSTA